MKGTQMGRLKKEVCYLNVNLYDMIYRRWWKECRWCTTSRRSGDPRSCLRGWRWKTCHPCHLNPCALTSPPGTHPAPLHSPPTPSTTSSTSPSQSPFSFSSSTSWVEPLSSMSGSLGASSRASTLYSSPWAQLALATSCLRCITVTQLHIACFVFHLQ